MLGSAPCDRPPALAGLPRPPRSPRNQLACDVQIGAAATSKAGAFSHSRAAWQARIVVKGTHFLKMKTRLANNRTVGQGSGPGRTRPTTLFARQPLRLQCT